MSIVTPRKKALDFSGLAVHLSGAVVGVEPEFRFELFAAAVDEFGQGFLAEPGIRHKAPPCRSRRSKRS
jgi:hypothetical protein